MRKFLPALIFFCMVSTIHAQDYQSIFNDTEPKIVHKPLVPLNRPFEQTTRAVSQPEIPRESVAIDPTLEPGTVIVSTSERRLYLVTDRGSALKYGIGVGRDGFSWHGTEKVSRKATWPSWRPPAEMRKRRPDLPEHMPGGPANPLGARALYLGDTLYRIHGSNEPRTIGHAVSSGCIRMTNEDIIDLYNRVPIGATVIVRP